MSNSGQSKKQKKHDLIHDTQSARISQKQEGRNIYAIMKQCAWVVHLCPSAWVATKSLWTVVITGRAHCFCDCIYKNGEFSQLDSATGCLVTYIVVYKFDVKFFF